MRVLDLQLAFELVDLDTVQRFDGEQRVDKKAVAARMKKYGQKKKAKSRKSKGI